MRGDFDFVFVFGVGVGKIWVVCIVMAFLLVPCMYGEW